MLEKRLLIRKPSTKDIHIINTRLEQALTFTLIFILTLTRLFLTIKMKKTMSKL